MKENFSLQHKQELPWSPLLSLLIFTDSFWGVLFFPGMHPGPQERRGVPQVHPQEQRQHARRGEPHQRPRAAGQRLVHHGRSGLPPLLHCGPPKVCECAQKANSVLAPFPLPEHSAATLALWWFLAYAVWGFGFGAFFKQPL